MRWQFLSVVFLSLAAASGQPAAPIGDSPQPPPTPAPSATAGQIVIPAGAWIKIRVDDPLSSDQNQTGDRFSGTLTQPVIADGYVVAHRGQTVEGRVTDVAKAGRSKGTSRLGIELLEIGLADGQQMPVRTQLIEYAGGTSKGRDAAAIGTTTGAGAAIGAAAAGGFGAGMGALAGAAASTIGVLATRGRATEITPETVVTFRTLEPITISTERAPHAFQPVRQNDYEPRQMERRPAPQRQPTLYSPVFVPGGYYGWGGMWGPGPWGGGWYGPRYRGWGRGGFVGGGVVIRRR